MFLISAWLLKWADAGNLRSFPWRETKDPYKILIAELLLRRTNAKAVESVYLHFLEVYPTLSDFISATPSELNKITFSLGLKWRAKNLVALSSKFLESHTEKVPSKLDDLIRLPGVGPYVARAILINSEDIPSVAVDSNVVRVVSRYFGIEASDSLRRNKKFQDFCDSLVPLHRARDFNYALLDLAALICRPISPDCINCPLARNCEAYIESLYD